MKKRRGTPHTCCSLALSFYLIHLATSVIKADDISVPSRNQGNTRVSCYNGTEDCLREFELLKRDYNEVTREESNERHLCNVYTRSLVCLQEVLSTCQPSHTDMLHARVRISQSRAEMLERCSVLSNTATERQVSSSPNTQHATQQTTVSHSIPQTTEATTTNQASPVHNDGYDSSVSAAMSASSTSRQFYTVTVARSQHPTSHFSTDTPEKTSSPASSSTTSISANRSTEGMQNTTSTINDGSATERSTVSENMTSESSTKHGVQTSESNEHTSTTPVTTPASRDVTHSAITHIPDCPDRSACSASTALNKPCLVFILSSVTIYSITVGFISVHT